MHVLIDACVAAAYYHPESTGSIRLRERSQQLITSARSSGEPFLYIPNFCVAEVFGVFDKYRFGKSWNPHVKNTSSKALSKQKYDKARKRFQDEIHNGRVLNHFELARYHVLYYDFISPVDNAYQYSRMRVTKVGKKVPRRLSPMGSHDLLIIAMGIYLQKVHGRDGFCIFTGDRRIYEIVTMFRSRIENSTVGSPLLVHLRGVAKKLGLKFSAQLYPHVIDAVHNTNPEIREIFGSWPP